MTSFGRTIRIVLSAVAGVVLGVVVLVQFTDYCRLKAVTLDGRPVSDFPSRYPLSPARTIADQPVERVASQLLDEHGIVKVDIRYALPCSLRISTNDFTPDCLVLDKSSGYVYGLDGDGRIIPLKDSSQIWNLPLMTGVRMYRLYSFCDDIRTQLLVPQLHELREENPNEYQMIEEIDFSNESYLTVRVAGVPYPIRAAADNFATQMHQFFAFLTTFAPDMSAATTVDLRFAPMIVRVGQPDTTDADSAGGRR